MSQFISINSVAEVHAQLGLTPPKHPLITVIPVKDLQYAPQYNDVRLTLNLYHISLKDGANCHLNYGRNSYDFTNGTMVFSKPNQVFTPNDTTVSEDAKGWILLFHPDLIRKSELGKNIEQYSFFSYEVHEALHLSESEIDTITELMHKIEMEYQQIIDKHSQKLMVANIELILDYSMRYYDRQFYVRTNLNQDLISKFDQLLKEYYASDKPQELGVPSVKYCGETLGMSPNYLSDLLKKETGTNAKGHIQTFIVNSAKNKLLGTTASISEIAYELGFEYPQHFSTLFKNNTGSSPAAYRSVN